MTADYYFHHAGFEGEADFDGEKYIGKITGITDLVTFTGKDIAEACNAFEETHKGGYHEAGTGTV